MLTVCEKSTFYPNLEAALKQLWPPTLNETHTAAAMCAPATLTVNMTSRTGAMDSNIEAA